MSSLLQTILIFFGLTIFGLDAYANPSLSNQSCLEIATKCESSTSNIKTILKVLCEKRLTDLQCDQMKSSASLSEKEKFVDCTNPQKLCDFVAPSLGAQIYSCANGLGGVLVDTALGILFLPVTVYKLVSKIPDIPGVLRNCYEDQNAKLAYMGALRPKEMTDETLKNMSCYDVQKFIQVKVEVLLARIEAKRQDEMIKRGKYDLTTSDLRLTEDEVQALNFDLARAGAYRKAQCFTAQDAAQLACEDLARISIGFGGTIAAAKLVRVLKGTSREIPVTAIAEGSKVDMAAVLRKTFGPNKGQLPSEVARLDEVLASDLQGIAEKLTPRQQATFVSVLENPKPGIKGLPPGEESAGFVGLGKGAHSADAAIEINNMLGFRLLIDVVAREHPLSRLFVRHEASHLSRYVSEAVTPSDMAATANGVRSRRLGIYRDELSAFGDQYDYLRRVYSVEDLPRLRETMPGPSPADTAASVKTGFLTVTGDGKIMDINFNKVPDLAPESLAAVKRYLRGSMNELFVDQVTQALTQTKSAYTKAGVAAPVYSSQQKAATTRNAINDALRWAFWASIPGGAGAAGLNELSQ